MLSLLSTVCGVLIYLLKEVNDHTDEWIS